MRARVSNALGMPVPDMARSEQGYDRHPGPGAGGDSDRMILDHQAVRRRHAQLIGGMEIDVRMGLAARESRPR
jgi:hypothetical protein